MIYPNARNSLPWLVVGVGALAFLPLLGGAARAQTSEEALFRNMWQTVQARKLLLDDPQLGPLSLGVHVTNRIAVLWGPVPSRELGLRAELRLRTMVELTEVRNGLTIDPDFAGVPPAPLDPDGPRLLPDALPPPRVPGAPRPPVLEPQSGVALAGIVTPDETFIARSSPGPGQAPGAAGHPTLHMPFLGSVSLPR
jgi:hypothetical protein